MRYESMDWSLEVPDGLTGLLTRFTENVRFWTKWWLRAGCQRIHATYNCLLVDRGREDTEGGSLIESLTPEYGANAD